MKAQDFVAKQIGRLWVLQDLAKHGPSKQRRTWWKHHIKQLHERGMIKRSIRVPGGWEITSKGLEAMQ